MAYVSFTQDPDDVSEYARVLRCPMKTGASWNGWALPKADLVLPLRRRDPALRRWLERRAVDLLARLPATTDLRDEVRHALATQMAAGDMTLMLSQRLVFSRPLSVGWRKRGLPSIICARTHGSGRRNCISPSDALDFRNAYLLGTRATGFHRAFKRWHGTTPEAFRRNLGQRPHDLVFGVTSIPLALVSGTWLVS